MPRPPNIDRPTVLNICLPETLRAKLDVFLFSEAEGKVPYGSYNRFFVERLTEFFNRFEASKDGKHIVP